MSQEAGGLLVVVGALFVAGGRVLLARRRSEGIHGGLWELPGGKVEEGEAPDAALAREILEELGVGILPRGASRSYEGSLGDRPWRFVVTPVLFGPGALTLAVHHEFRYFAEAEIPWASLAPLDTEPLRDWVEGRFGEP